MKNPEKNVNGVFAFMSPSFPFQNQKIVEEIQVIAIQKTMADLNDFIDDRAYGINKLSITLLPEGDGILIEEPTIPKFIRGKVLDIEKFYDGLPPDMAAACCRAHAIEVNNILAAESHGGNRKYIYRFQDGIRCVPGYMNGNDGKITIKMRVTTSIFTKTNTQFHHYAASMFIVVENPEGRQEILRDKGGEDDGLAELVAAINNSMSLS